MCMLKELFHFLTVSTLRFAWCWWCLQPLKYTSVLKEAQSSSLWPYGIHNGGNIAGIPVATCRNQRLASKTNGIPTPGYEYIHTDSEETHTVWNLRVCYRAEHMLVRAHGQSTTVKQSKYDYHCEMFNEIAPNIKLKFHLNPYSDWISFSRAFWKNCLDERTDNIFIWILSTSQCDANVNVNATDWGHWFP